MAAADVIAADVIKADVTKADAVITADVRTMVAALRSSGIRTRTDPSNNKS